MLAANGCHHELRIGEKPRRRGRAFADHVHLVARRLACPRPLSNLDQLTV